MQLIPRSECIAPSRSDAGKKAAFVLRELPVHSAGTLLERFAGGGMHLESGHNNSEEVVVQVLRRKRQNVGVQVLYR